MASVEPTMLEVAKGVGWVVLWEIGKLGLSHLAKRRADQGDVRRKLLRDNFSAAVDKANDCLALAARFYAGTPEERALEGAKLAREVRHEMHVLATLITGLNMGLQQVGAAPLDSMLTVRFRQALTMRLDEANLPQFASGDPLVNGMYTAGALLTVELTRRKHEFI